MLLDAIENAVNGTVADMGIAVGTIVQMEPTAQPAIEVGISFSNVSDGFAKVRVTAVKFPAGIFAAVARYATSVWRRTKSTVADPENKETFPGVSVAPVRVTWAERMVTFDGGVSVMTITTEEFPVFWLPEPNWLMLPQPANAAHKTSAEIAQIDRIRNMLPR